MAHITLQGTLNLRTVEYHEYRPGGQLKARKHYDAGSLITVDLMLADPGTHLRSPALFVAFVVGVD